MRLGRPPIFVFAALSAALFAAEGGGQSYPAFRGGVFADANLSYSLVSHASELEFGEIDPYGEIRFSETWSAIGELLFQRIERGSSADRPGRKSVELDIERLFAAYAPSDAFKIQVGEINSGIIQWNSEQLPRFVQTPIDVPSIARRQEQGGAWPLHLLGAWLSGRAAGSAGLLYGIGAGVGRGPHRDDTSFPGTDSGAGLAALSVSPAWAPGWTIGAAVLVDRIPAREGTYDELARTVSTSYLRGPLEVRAEWSRMDHRLSGVDHVTTGWYALVSYRLPGGLRALRPYVLVDQLDVANEEPYLSDILDQRSWSAGVRWDVAAHLVLKGDFQSQRARESQEERRIRLQVAVAF